jgi:TIR domain
MSVSFSIGRFVERIVILFFAALGGAVVGVWLSPKGGEAIVPGAVIGASLVLLKWIVGGARRGVAKRSGPAELGTIMSITSQPPPGAPWYHHTYALIDVQGKRRKLKLTPEQAREFSEKYSEGDVGRIAYSGERLLAFTPVTPTAPVREKTGIKAFISYAHGNDPESQMAEYVAEVLETSGLEPWVDRSEVQPGQQLRFDLVKQIRESDYFVPLLSKEYMASEWCLREFEIAADAGIPMKPIKIKEAGLVPPPYLKKLYEEKAGEPVYLDMTSRHAPQKLREMAEDMAHRK